MSDLVVQLVPDDRAFVPSDDALRAVVDRARAMFVGADEVHAEVSEEVRFVDAGENMGGIACPGCGASLEEEWADAMSAAAEHEFRDLSMHAPCCGRRVSLDGLRYEWPVAFARFVIAIRNPRREVSREAIAELEEILATPLRSVIARY